MSQNLEVIAAYIREVEGLGKGENQLRLVAEQDGDGGWIAYFWLTDSRLKQSYRTFISLGSTIEEALARMAREVDLINRR